MGMALNTSPNSVDKIGCKREKKRKEKQEVHSFPLDTVLLSDALSLQLQHNDGMGRDLGWKLQITVTGVFR